MDKLPKYIEQKCDRLNKLLEDAGRLQYEIEMWSKSKGIDTYGDDWYSEVLDDISSVSGIYKDELLNLVNRVTQ